MRHPWRVTSPLVLACALLTSSPDLRATDASLGTRICAELSLLLPEVQSFSPEAARARFVSAISMKFQHDADELREVRTGIDRLATASCRKERDGLLRVMQYLSLSEALDEHW